MSTKSKKEVLKSNAKFVGFFLLFDCGAWLATWAMQTIDQRWMTPLVITIVSAVVVFFVAFFSELLDENKEVE